MAIEEYREFILEVVEGEKAEGPQITSIICDTRYLRHPRLSDGSRGGVRILGGPRGAPNVSSAIFGRILRV